MSCHFSFPPFDDFEPGDLVRQHPNGPILTVVHNGRDKHTGEEWAFVGWFDKDLGRCRYTIYRPDQLRPL